MLDGIDLDDKENVASVTNVIKAVLDGVKVWVLKMMWQCAKVEFSEETETGCVVCL